MSDNLPEIIARAQAGEEEAFRMLVEQHSRSVFNVAYRIVGNPADAEEAVQETFLRVFKKLHSFEERARFTTWLYRVAANSAMDLVRKQALFWLGQTGDERALALIEELLLGT